VPHFEPKLTSKIGRMGNSIRVDRGRGYWASRELPNKVSNGYRSTSGSVGAGKSGQSRRLGGGHWGSGQAGAQQVSNPIVTLGSGGRGGTVPSAPSHAEVEGLRYLLPLRVIRALERAFEKASAGGNIATLDQVGRWIDPITLRSWPCVLTGNWASSLNSVFLSLRNSRHFPKGAGGVTISLQDLLGFFSGTYRGDTSPSPRIRLRVTRAEGYAIQKLFHSLPKDEEQRVNVASLRAAMGKRDDLLPLIIQPADMGGNIGHLFEALDNLRFKMIGLEDLMWWFVDPKFLTSSSPNHNPNPPKTSLDCERKTRFESMAKRDNALAADIESRLKQRLLEKWDTLITAWRILDKDNKGHITLPEFAWGLTQSGFGWVHPDTIAGLFHNANTTGNDQRLTFKEFKAAFASYLRGDPRPKVIKTQQKATQALPLPVPQAPSRSGSDGKALAKLRPLLEENWSALSAALQSLCLKGDKMSVEYLENAMDAVGLSFIHPKALSALYHHTGGDGPVTIKDYAPRLKVWVFRQKLSVPRKEQSAAQHLSTSNETKSKSESTESKKPGDVAEAEAAIKRAIIQKWDTLIAAWRVLDRNKDLNMSLQEFSWGLSYCGLGHIPAETVVKLFRGAEKNLNGSLSFKEFKEAFSSYLQDEIPRADTETKAAPQPRNKPKPHPKAALPVYHRNAVPALAPKIEGYTEDTLRSMLLDRWDTLVTAWRILDKNNDRKMKFSEFEWGVRSNLQKQT